MNFFGKYTKNIKFLKNVPKLWNFEKCIKINILKIAKLLKKLLKIVIYKKIGVFL